MILQVARGQVRSDRSKYGSSTFAQSLTGNRKGLSLYDSDPNYEEMKSRFLLQEKEQEDEDEWEDLRLN